MKTSVTIIGLGNMGRSLARGLCKSSLMNEVDLRVFDIHRDVAREFCQESSAFFIDEISRESFHKGVIVICVKPHDLPYVAKGIKDNLSKETLIISILAGVPIDEISSCMQHGGPVVRAMPNIAAKVGSAATVMCGNDLCSEEDRYIAEHIFKGVGECYWTKEGLMNTVTGLSGSGPAYIYMVIEALTDGGVKMGLPRKLSFDLSVQTVLGAAKMVKESKEHPAILKDQVTTPAGTTILALHELEERGLRSMFVHAVEKATLRAEDLGK